jgi:hypothetical protein
MPALPHHLQSTTCCASSICASNVQGWRALPCGAPHRWPAPAQMRCCSCAVDLCSPSSCLQPPAVACSWEMPWSTCARCSPAARNRCGLQHLGSVLQHQHQALQQCPPSSACARRPRSCSSSALSASACHRRRRLQAGTLPLPHRHLVAFASARLHRSAYQPGRTARWCLGFGSRRGCPAHTSSLQQLLRPVQQPAELAERCSSATLCTRTHPRSRSAPLHEHPRCCWTARCTYKRTRPFVHELAASL